ncbi:hypothetical protein BD769DRAFT_1382809 [Suillus cothurnatus]|nr:hypothetical protein BD769DRAFT_1382809 [Suillus cothurnatus]
MQAYKTAVNKWDRKDVIVRQQISVLGPDSQFIQLLSLISAKDFHDMLKNQFKNCYNNILSAVLTSIQLHQKTPTVHELMNLITNEYNRLLIQNGTIGKLKSEDVAFLADGTSHKGKQYQNKSKFPYNCNNCGWKGHKKEDCWEEGGGKAGKGLKGWKSCRKKSKSKDNDKLKASRLNTDILKLKDDSKPGGVWLASTKDIWDEEPEPYDVS